MSLPPALSMGGHLSQPFIGGYIPSQSMPQYSWISRQVPFQQPLYMQQGLYNPYVSLGPYDPYAQ